MSRRERPIRAAVPFCVAALSCVMFAGLAFAADPPAATPIQNDVLGHLDSIRGELVQANQEIWAYSELGLEEYRSAAKLTGLLKQAGFKVKQDVSAMPTAFVAEYGSGRPIIGILAEYDALPELSQQAVGIRQLAEGRSNGHGCGHSALGTAAVGAAMAVKQVYDKHKLKGTVRVYGTPAEETLIGKVYMTLDKQFDDLDVCLHWHPGNRNKVKYDSSKAMISAKFTFAGLPAHASSSPDKGRSALDGVELMNVANYMREHVPENARIHYVTTNGGQQPNVVPSAAQVWYYVRANQHGDAEAIYDWLVQIAEGAAKMSRTSVKVQVDTDCHEIIPNLPLSNLVLKNLKLVGPPKFDDSDRELAKQLRAPLLAEFGSKSPEPLHEAIDELPLPTVDPSGGSTDVGDVSWFVPMSGLSTACFAAESPGHSWQNAAAIGSPIGHKGMMVAAKVLALSLVDLLQDAQLVTDAKADFKERMKDRKYTTRVPEGQKAPRSIR